MHNWNRIISAIRLVLDSKIYLIAFLVIASLSFLGYSYLLSSSSLNLPHPKIILGLNIYSLITAAVISILLALSLIMNAFAFANRVSLSEKISLGAIIMAILPSSLCCTPVIPALLATFGASTTTIIGATGMLQGPFATYEVLFIIASLILFLLSIFLVSININKCCIVKK